MEQNTPNFEGEEMKLPSQQPAKLMRDKPVLNLTIIISLMVVLLFILGGLYYAWQLNNSLPNPAPDASRPTLETNREPETPTATAQIESMTALSTSDEIVAIEADLESTLLDSLESELLQIEAELEADF
jgi:hypothetical protein